MSIQEEYEFFKEMKRVEKFKKSNDKRKYFLISFYLFFAYLYAFSPVFANENYSHEKIEESFLSEFFQCPCCENYISRKAFLFWTCEYCKTVNPSLVSTCQSCRRPKEW